MEHITKPSNAVNLDSGQRRDLEEIIESLRKDIIVPKNGNRDTSPSSAEDERPDSSTARRDRMFDGRAAAIRMGLLGIAQRIPA